MFDPDRLEYGRPRPLYDLEIHGTLKSILDARISDENDLYQNFKSTFHQWIQSSKKNKIIGLNEFPVSNVIHGVTHALDDFNVTFGDRLVFPPEDYPYHRRIKPNSRYLHFSKWKKGDVAIISSPFCHTGKIHDEMNDMIKHCEENEIDIHIDAAWFGPNLGYTLDLSSCAIKSVSFSLSKAIGIGKYQCGIRYEKGPLPGPVKVINDFKYLHTSCILIGLTMMEKFPVDYFVDKYGEAYQQVIKEMGLNPTSTLHVALKWDEGEKEMVPVGIRGYLRQVVEGQFR